MSYQKYYTFDDVQIVPQYSDIYSRSNCDISNSRLTKSYTIDIPLVSAPMDTVTGVDMALELLDLGGAGFIHRFMSSIEQADCIVPLVDSVRYKGYDKNKTPICGTIGVTGDYIKRARVLLSIGANVLLLDVAHGHHELVKEALFNLTNLKEEFDFEVIAGNVCTWEGTQDLIEWGADGIRVGVGNGSMCSTRIQTGVGLPSISSIKECVEVGNDYNVPIMADGGIRSPGDVCKALGAGASTVMIGSLLSGTKESPGQITKVGSWPNEVLQKKYRGSASIESKKDRGENKNVEGVSRYVLYKGKTKRVIEDICDGLRSSMSYVGAKDLEEFRKKCKFVTVTNAGMVEARPHGL